MNLQEHDEHVTREIHKVEAEVERVETEVERVEADMKNKNVSSNRAITIQTIMLVVTLVGIAMAAERRLTAHEVQMKAETEVRQRIDSDHAQLIKSLQDAQIRVIENQARVITLLEVVDKRHSLEDSKR